MSNQQQAMEQTYVALVHAIQTGVATKRGIDPSETSPKQLRTGVNVALCDLSALIELLVEKGLFTKEEFLAASVRALTREVNSYETYLTTKTGQPITLR